MRGRVLIVAGSDSGGGAGIQGDLKTVTALSGYAATALTALTAQNTRGVFGILAVPPDFIIQQMRLVLEDIGADCIKTGMLHNSVVIDAVVGVLADMAPKTPLVVDPVMFAKGGAALLDPAARESLSTRLLPRATVVTPNTEEAEALTGIAITDPDAMVVAARILLDLGPQAVLIKGGHLPGENVINLLVTAQSVHRFVQPRLESPHTHGTGCTLASAVATGLAQNLSLVAAVERALDYVHEAIRSAPGLGGGHGPLNHAHTVRPQ
ncbi:MAG: bifunctional hydroxymethylpyrimidine kinase/phosphomethylpyrimidine kinase [Gammaproteobacteria bacterium]|nr:bifunctional hydroxymethylpyrimidine kinase/phosphomethylpyrimidine kinase [Gammaproteobacteria bacterium]MCP5458653.1 bifunctional hydroxymethylpyrimidine kinase/phosphomethylpyrimidine kinase [Gammaproteobacteria bacterium]